MFGDEKRLKTMRLLAQVDMRGLTGSGCNHRTGFTLVELLIVMVIISLLAAMLLPVLREAVLSARISVCANNQRQLYLGAVM